MKHQPMEKPLVNKLNQIFATEKTTSGRLQALIASPVVLAAVVLALALWPRVTDLGVFVGPDEFYWLTGSVNFIEALRTGDLAKTYHAGQPGVTLMWAEAIGAGGRYVGHLLGAPGGQTVLVDEKSMPMLELGRQVAAVANALLLVVIVLQVRAIFGSGVAWLAGFLLAFDAFFLTESRALRTESFVTSFNTVALLTILLYLRKPRPWLSAVIGLTIGLALLSKVSALALVPVGLLV
ncbi:MAG: glycosyltransferase family 39 protein, partial [Anaerolineae bacterium]|nr:glycosyltransferase family 39 protein [Anaerolineae bacterium]